MHRHFRIAVLLVCCSAPVHAEPTISLPTEKIVGRGPRDALRGEAAQIAEIESSLRQIKELHRQLSEQHPDDPRLKELSKEIQRLELKTRELWKEAQRVARSGSEPVSDQTRAKSRARLRARLEQEPVKKGQTASR